MTVPLLPARRAACRRRSGGGSGIRRPSSREGPTPESMRRARRSRAPAGRTTSPPTTGCGGRGSPSGAGWTQDRRSTGVLRGPSRFASAAGLADRSDHTGREGARESLGHGGPQAGRGGAARANPALRARSAAVRARHRRRRRRGKRRRRSAIEQNQTETSARAARPQLVLNQHKRQVRAASLSLT